MSRRPSRSSAEAPAAKVTCALSFDHDSAPWIVKPSPLVMRVAAPVATSTTHRCTFAAGRSNRRSSSRRSMADVSTAGGASATV